MPKYTFKCRDCGNMYSVFTGANDEPRCGICGGESKRQLPKLNGPAEVKETVDSMSGKSHRQDQKELIKERNEEYFWRVEVPKLAKDPKYSIETKIDNGWIWIDDKGQIQVYDKPPHKR